MGGVLLRRHCGDEEPGVKALVAHRWQAWRDPAAPGQHVLGLQAHPQVGQHLVEGLGPVVHQRCACVCAVVAKQDPGFLKGLAQGGHIQAGGGGHVQCGLAQGGVQPGRVLVQMGGGVQLAVTAVELAAGEYIGSAQHVRQAVALEQEDFQAAGGVAQHDDGGGVAGRIGGDFRVQFHGRKGEAVGGQGGRRCARAGVSAVAGPGEGPKTAALPDRPGWQGRHCLQSP